MMVKHQVFIVLIISLLLYVGNSEAGWKFWEKDKPTTTTTTTSIPTAVSIQSVATPATPKATSIRGSTTLAVNTVTGTTANPKLETGVNGKQNVRNNMRLNQPNPGTEVGWDIAVPRPNQPGNNGDSRRQPNLPTAFTTASPVRIDQNSPHRPSNGNTVTTHASSTPSTHRPASLLPDLPKDPKNSAGNEGRTTPRTPTRPSQPHQPNRPTLAVAATGGPAATVRTTANPNSVSDPTRKVYSSDPIYSKGNTVTDEDLEKLSEALYIKEKNNANRYITINLQKKTTSSSPTDQAPQPLFTVNSEAFQIPTIQKVLSLFDNYQLDTRTNEYISPAQREEESLLVDTFLSTDVMSAAMRFLANKGFVRQDYYEYKDLLRRIWFNLFSRGQGKIGSTGFEHVFMAETRQVDSGTEVLGLHNWIYFNAEETKNHIDYLGYMKKIDLGNKGSIIKMHTKLNGHDKPVVTVFVGTSPELEMALYSVCFYARPDATCPVSLGGTKFNIITHKFRYRGKDLIGTAYPDI